MIPSLLAAHTGMPEKPQAPAVKSDAGQHLHHALAAHKKGDHHGAKKHALKAVNMLHRMAPAAPPDPTAPAAA